MSNERSHDNIKNAPKEKQQIQNKERKDLGMDGKNGGQKTSNFPLFNKAKCEKVISREDAYIVLGKDRNASLESGKSGMGADACYAIDLVVGRNSSAKKSGPQNSETMVDTNFFTDAARVYISQKSDIDHYLGLCKGSETDEEDSNNKSCVVLKADQIRIVGRNHIKIVTGKGKTSGVGTSGERNSQGGDIEVVGKIDFIAGNNADSNPSIGTLGDSLGNVNKLQPLVKGENMLELMEEIVEHLGHLYSFVESNRMHHQTLHTILSTSFAAIGAVPVFSPFLAPGAAIGAVIPLLTAKKPDIAFQQNNLEVGTKTDYLTEKGERYINSAYVNTT
tara:strand:- start:250 stop:1251 length:1002 start_codon:yes stop_codon:yes gene_type:complete